ncbi:MAG: MATE family efflux transporter [Clostridia bacterium]|nr:MATE family efflux transporter [Clostridia bacterium]
MEQNKMGVMPINKLIINMSLPMMISMLVQALYNIVDSVFVGMVNEQSLTAVSLSFPAQNLMIAVATGTGVGVNALISRSLGERNFAKANKIAENGIFLALCSAVVFFFLGVFGAEAFMRSQTDVEYIIEQGTSYLQICCGASFGIFLEIIFERLLQATGRTTLTMCTQGVGAICNIILDPIFIFVFKMGVTGAAVATVTGQIIAFIIAAVLNAKKNPEISLNLKKFRPDLKAIGQIYRIGVPSIIMVAIGSVMTFCMNKILILYTPGKETAATVFGAFFKLNSFICMPIFGLNNGIIPIVAYNYGAQQKGRLIKTVKLAVVYAELFSLLGVLLFATIPHILLGFFSASPEMLEIGVPALRIIGSSFALAGICVSLGAVFQALGKSFFSMIVSLIRQLLVLTPVAFLLARYGQQTGNPNLVWFSYPIAELFSLTVTLICFAYIYKKIISKIKN